MSADTILCPSSRCEPGALLLGLVLPDGRVAYASDRIAVDDEFVDIARQGRSPEQRFRFASPCVQSACRQWTGNRCGVIDEVLDQVNRKAMSPEDDAADPVQMDLPPCSIRDDCRWWNQHGRSACEVCPLVITDSRDDVEPDSHDITESKPLVATQPVGSNVV